jgi:hypothetical protein
MLNEYSDPGTSLTVERSCHDVTKNITIYTLEKIKSSKHSNSRRSSNRSIVFPGRLRPRAALTQPLPGNIAHFKASGHNPHVRIQASVRGLWSYAEVFSHFGAQRHWLPTTFSVQMQATARIFTIDGYRGYHGCRVFRLHGLDL